MQRTVTSRDGTVIAFDETGTGPPVIVVAAALADRTGATKLSKNLAQRFTVLNYDRRGRGQSSDIKPYAIDREIEDIDALIDHAGGSAFLFGSSSGAVLALDAAARLGPKIKSLYIYEPPFIIDDGHPPMADGFAAEIEKLVEAGERNEAVKLFFGKGMGIPSFAVTLMRYLMPGWSKMTKVAHTLPYDLAILKGTQNGHPLPARRWSAASSPVLVMVGSKSEPFFHNGAKALAAILPNGRYDVLAGKSHSAILMATKELAEAAGEFYQARD